MIDYLIVYPKRPRIKTRLLFLTSILSTVLILCRINYAVEQQNKPTKTTNRKGKTP